MRSIVIFGNGLGMALDSSYFCLSRAMQESWDRVGGIDEPQQELILDCMRTQGINEPPTDESHLSPLHLAVVACEALHFLENGSSGWLNENGHNFPAACRQYFTDVAWHFHNHYHELPESFLNPLFNFIFETQSHVATLNYDNLMYQKMIEAEILNGYNGALVDGFHDAGFKAENLERKQKHDFGYYLHLHGSPLFIDDHGRQIKQKQPTKENIPTPHLVLAEVSFKPTMIDASPVLRTYWNYLNYALQEAQSIYLVGYSGLDSHLNITIRSHAASRPVRIIEWKNPKKEDEERRMFWQGELGKEDVELTRLDNILTFTDWR